MIPERHMKQAQRANGKGMTQGYLFYIQAEGRDVPCIAVASLAANDYGEIYESCYHIIDPATIEDASVKPILVERIMNGACEISRYRCPNCEVGISKLDNYCDCGQCIDWS